MSVTFKDNHIQVENEMNDAIIAFLHEASGEIVSTTQRNSRVATGKTKGSFSYEVDESKRESTIGSPDENAVLEEFGTGEYAVNGDGRKGGWFYKDEKGEGHFTHGKTPSRAMHKAFTALESKIKNQMENLLKGVGK